MVAESDRLARRVLTCNPRLTEESGRLHGTQAEFGRIGVWPEANHARDKLTSSGIGLTAGLGPDGVVARVEDS